MKRPVTLGIVLVIALAGAPMADAAPAPDVRSPNAGWNCGLGFTLGSFLGCMIRWALSEVTVGVPE